MENLDQRDLDVARFTKHVLDLWTYTGLEPEVGLRLSSLLLFTAHYGHPPGWPEQSLSSPERLAEAFAGAQRWLGISLPVDHDWSRIPQTVFDELHREILSAENRAVALPRLDHVVRKLVSFRQQRASSMRLESFIANFAERLANVDGELLDLGVSTSGDIGIHAVSLRTNQKYVLQTDRSPNLLEVCLRLAAHKIPFKFLKQHDEDQWQAVSQAFHWPSTSRPAAAKRPARGATPQDLSGLEFADWFFQDRGRDRLSCIILPTGDLRARGWRYEIRRNLVERGVVVGVIELPSRVTGAARVSMLILRADRSGSPRDQVLMMSGRAVDGLTDEPLDRLAHFLSIPFRPGAEELSRRDLPSSELGVALENRARKMFSGSVREIPGFYCYVNARDILASDNISLDPLQWIPRRHAYVASDLLDGTPVSRILEDEKRPCSVYVIGNNGAGKSLLLRQLAKACVAAGRPVRAIASASSDRFDLKEGAAADYVYLGTRTSDTATHPRKLGRKLAEYIRTIYHEPRKASTFHNLLETLTFSGRHYLLPESPDSDPLSSVIEIGRDEMKQNLAGWKLGFGRADSSTIVPFENLSTGEQQVLLLVARLVAYAAARVVFLIDEPETSLHVAWQRALPRAFQAISQRFACQLVIATHSPIIVSAARGEGVHRFTAGGGVLEPISDRSASSVERVLFQGFDTYTDNNREVHERCAELVSKAIELVNTNQGEKLPEVVAELNRMYVTVERSTSALGGDSTLRHAELIRRALEAIGDLEAPEELTND